MPAAMRVAVVLRGKSVDLRRKQQGAYNGQNRAWNQSFVHIHLRNGVWQSVVEPVLIRPRRKQQYQRDGSRNRKTPEAGGLIL